MKLFDSIQQFIFGPKMVDVDSSAIEAIGHSRRQHALLVRFRNGRVYKYNDIDRFLYRRFLSADSKGRFFNKEVSHLYQYQQLTDK